MNIGIQTWGSHGDIRPFLALADGLQRAGHRVTLVITCVDSDRYRNLSPDSGFAVRIVASPVVQDARRLEAAGQALVRERNAIRQTQMAVEEFLLPAESAMFQASEQLCAENDLVIGHYFLYTLGAAARRQGRPWVSIALVHGGVPSAFRPPNGLPDLGRWGNRLAWWLGRLVLNRTLKKFPDRLCVQHGIPAAADLIDEVWASDQLTVLAISPELCPRQPDWPDHVQVCGNLDSPMHGVEGDISAPLQAFLAQGEPPVYMTFGSALSGSDSGETLSLLAESAREASMRAIIQGPQDAVSGLRSDQTIHYTNATPHAAVFPKCRMIVHHGGAGTTHAALRAGKPSVVVAHTAEQELWARELERIGAAPRLIRRRDATAAAIAAAMTRVAASDQIGTRAQQVGIRVASENGVANCVRLIERRFPGSGPSADSAWNSERT